MAAVPTAAEVRSQIDAAAHRVETIRSRKGGEDPYQLRRELWETMDAFVHVFRHTAELEKAGARLAELRSRSAGMGVKDTSGVFNTNLRDAMEIGNMIAGCAKDRLNERGCEVQAISVPSLILGASYDVYYARGIRTVSVQFEIDAIPVAYHRDRIFSTTVSLLRRLG